MAVDPPHRHNGGPLSDEDAEKLWGHIRALEVLGEQKAEIAEDEKARKALCKSDGFDTNIVGAILKRRKQGHGEAAAADQILRIYEQALEDQGALPLEQTRAPKQPPRSSVEDVAQRLHGQEPPEGLVKPDEEPHTYTGDAAEYYDRAVKLVREEGKASTSWLQRHFGIGYNSAARLIERMEKEGIVTKPDHIGRREVMQTHREAINQHIEQRVEGVENRLMQTMIDQAAGRIGAFLPEGVSVTVTTPTGKDDTVMREKFEQAREKAQGPDGARPTFDGPSKEPLFD
jgi:DNA segregation ATPase FtsK/SpoIIIE-like protein